MANANLLAMIANPNTGDPTAYAKGAQAGNALMKFRNDREAQALLPSALAGDKNALSQLAQFSPELAMRLDERNYDRGRDAIMDRRAAAGESRAQWDFQRRQAIDKAQRVAQVLLSADTPEKHAQAVTLLRAQGIQFGPGEDAFENREGLINQALSIEQQIDMRAPKAPMSAAGKVQHDINAGLLTPEQAAQANAPKKTGLGATAQKELFEADESAMAGENVINSLDQAIALNDKAYYGPAAKTRGEVMSWFGSEGGEATSNVTNIVTGQALDQLKATFGAMPTEGERKILLEIQGSVNQAPAVRAEIWKRAKALAQRRIEFNRNKAKGLRDGTYFGPDAAVSGPQPGMIEEGMRFIGGDPADPNSWEPAE
jgi:hypothetical protein